MVKVIIAPQKLVFDFSDEGKSLTFEIAQSWVKNLKVIDRKNFIEKLSGFLSENNFPKTSCLIVLSEGVYFSRELKNENGIKEFLESLQLDLVEIGYTQNIPIYNPSKDFGYRTIDDPAIGGRANWEYRIVKNQGREVIVAVNREFLNVVVDAINFYGARVIGAVPSGYLTDGKDFDLLQNKGNPEVKIESSGGGIFSKAWVILILFFVLAFGVSLFVLDRREMAGKSKLRVQSSIIISPTPIATPTPKKELSREELKIQVLNGSGVSGAAASMAEFLKEKGYLEIETGNADNSTYKETVIQIVKGKEEYFPLVTGDLAEKYIVASESAELTGSDFDAVIIIGKELK